ncbi:MAG: hypothetical protein WBA98_03700 [Gordonia sp. (in: high G+C Gram-positive bacteria)]|uniref:hypothetical protein n=1 Tax=Gordonia sp. (in: high G+C Gram-positive bacteria) TaxID=84139 RepID=UPI003C732CDC
MEHLNRVGDDDPTYSVPYQPEKRERHQWEDLFADIPLTVSSRRVRGGGRVWSPAEGTLYLPQTAARIAQHAELVGMVHDPERAKMRRARLATGVHVWVDVNTVLPAEQSRVDATAQALAEGLPEDERRALAEKLMEGLTDG